MIHIRLDAAGHLRGGGSANYPFSSVAKGPKFRPQSTKRAEKKLAGPGKSGAKLLPDLSKKGRKNFFQVWFFIKSSIFPALKAIPMNWYN
jgi:hypothetical protein